MLRMNGDSNSYINIDAILIWLAKLYQTIFFVGMLVHENYEMRQWPLALIALFN